MGAAPGRIPNTQLRRERELRGWSQERIAEELGTNKFMISRWERGVKTPSPYFREQLCRLFGKTAEELGFIPALPGGQGASETRLIWHVPLRRNPFFTGRETDLAQLYTALETSRTAALSQAISGLGGMGKSSLVLEYAYRYRAHYQAVLWVGADSCEHLLTNLAGLTRVLGLPEQYETDQGQAVAAVQFWLQEHTNWLLIIDNLEDLRLGEEVLPCGPGHLLVTTRALATGFVASRLELAPLPPEEGTLLLLRRARLLPLDAPLSQAPPDAQNWAEAITAHLDGLPLALDQVGAYLEETGCGLEDYLRRLETHQGALLQRRGQMMAGHPASVTATLMLSITRVRVAAPEAVELLECCAFLHPDAIPEELFTQGATELGPRIAAAGADPVKLDALLETLGHFSLLRRDPHTRTLRLHRLVQAVLKEHLSPEQQRIWADRIVRALHHLLPEVGLTSWVDFPRHASQARRGCELISFWKLHSLEASHFLAKTGAYLWEQAFYPEAKHVLMCALALQKRTLGRQHADTARTLYHLAELSRDEGHYRRAHILFQQALQIQEQTLSPQHPHLAHTLIGLADFYLYQGQAARGESLVCRALQILEQVLGPTHPDIAEGLNIFARLSGDLGKYERAITLYRQAIALAEAQYGALHPQVAKSLGNLANAFGKCQDYTQAEKLYQRALAIWEQTMGPGHPEFAYALHNLANLYEWQGQFAKAEPLASRSYTLIEQNLGSDHPDVAFSQELLARIAQGLGNGAKAEGLAQQALSLRSRKLGPTHFLTIGSLSTLAHIFQDQERYTEAEELLQRVLALSAQVLGPDHHRVATSLEQYARLLRQTQRESEAIILEVRAQAIRAKAAEETTHS